MKVVHLSTIDMGGAYEATQRISDCLVMSGIDSKVIVRTKYRETTNAIPFHNSKIQKILSKCKNFMNLLISDGEIVFDKYGSDICHHPLIKEADVICLHWVNSFISNKEVENLLSLGKPVYWIMHDMWPFTGGCHYTGECSKYMEKCTACPMMRYRKNATLYWQDRKKEIFQKKNLYPIGPSQWISECAEKSSIFNSKAVEMIHNPIDINVFYPKQYDEIMEIKRRYGISRKKTTILFSAAKVTNNPIKGFAYFVEAVKGLPKDEYQILVLGKSMGQAELKQEIDLDIIYAGFVNCAAQMSDIYNISDLLVAPSLQENYSNTVLEALACGIPVVAFNIGGMGDLIEHGQNGYLAKERDSQDLYHGILEVSHNREKMGNTAREKVLRDNSFSVIAQKYIEIFERYRENIK